MEPVTDNKLYIAFFSNGETVIRIPFSTNFQTTLPVIRIRELIKTLKGSMPILKDCVLSGYTPTNMASIKNEFGKTITEMPFIQHTKQGIQTSWSYTVPNEITYTVRPERKKK